MGWIMTVGGSARTLAGGDNDKYWDIVNGYNKAVLKNTVDLESIDCILMAGVPIVRELETITGHRGRNFFEALGRHEISVEMLDRAMSAICFRIEVNND